MTVYFKIVILSYIYYILYYLKYLLLAGFQVYYFIFTVSGYYLFIYVEEFQPSPKQKKVSIAI